MKSQKKNLPFTQRASPYGGNHNVPPVAPTVDLLCSDEAAGKPSFFIIIILQALIRAPLDRLASRREICRPLLLAWPLSCVLTGSSSSQKSPRLSSPCCCSHMKDHSRGELSVDQQSPSPASLNMLVPMSREMFCSSQWICTSEAFLFHSLFLGL